MVTRSLTVIGAVCTMFAVSLAPRVAEANPLEPPWVYELVQDGENVEVTIRHTYLNVGHEGPGPGEEELTLVRYSEDDGSMRVIFERRVFTRESDGVECGDWMCPDQDDEACAEDPDSCFDCDEDDTPECPDGAACVSNGCESVEVDDCVGPGTQTYALFLWHDGEYMNCDWTHHVDIAVEEVGQDCPAYSDTFECIDLPSTEGEPDPGSSGCSTAPPRTAGSMTLAMLLLGFGGFLISRIRQRR